MADKAESGMDFITPETIVKFRALLKDDETYTDNELAGVLTFVGSMEVLFRNLPPYLPPFIRASLVANEFGPKVLAPMVNAHAIDPIAMATFIEGIGEGGRSKDEKNKPLLN